MKETTYTKEEMIKFYKNVPGDIRGILLDKNFGPSFQVIGRENDISPLQSLDLEDVAVYILLGVEPLNQFSHLLQGKLGVSREKAEKIAKSIDENIFYQIRESLRKIQGDNNIRIKKIDKQNTPTHKPESPVPAPTNYNLDNTTPNIAPPKTIVGAEKVGVGVPQKEEHMFEKKLREMSENMKIPKTEIEDTEPAKTKIQPERIDPYREVTE